MHNIYFEYVDPGYPFPLLLLVCTKRVTWPSLQWYYFPCQSPVSRLKDVYTCRLWDEVLDCSLCTSCSVDVNNPTASYDKDLHQEEATSKERRFHDDRLADIMFFFRSIWASLPRFQPTSASELDCCRLRPLTRICLNFKAASRERHFYDDCLCSSLDLSELFARIPINCWIRL